MDAKRLTVATPLGPVAVSESDGAIVALDWGAAASDSETPLLAAAARQLEAYFAGRAQGFDLPLAPPGSPFDRTVWEAMRCVPYGATRSYGDLARNLGSTPRAVGGACGRNPLPILIPCHRILAADDRLGGYSGRGGRETKQFLLRLEGARTGSGLQPDLFDARMSSA